MFYDKQGLLRQVTAFLTAYPEDAPAVLDAVSQGLKNFKEGVGKQRESQAWMAIDFLHGLFYPEVKWKKEKIAWLRMEPKMKIVHLIDSIVYAYPKGWESAERGSQVNIYMLGMFCDLYFNQSEMHGSDWEKDTKGYSDYMTTLKFQWLERKKKEEESDSVVSG